MRLHSAIVACLFAGLPACSHDLDLPADPGPPPPGGAITGRFLTQDPLSGNRNPTPTAHAEVLRTTVRATATKDGLFSFRPPDHAWQALFRDSCGDDGVCALQKLVNSGDLPLLPDVDFSLGDVLLSANGLAQGRVQLADRADPDHGQGGVTVYVSGAPFRTETGDNGVFVLPNLPEGTMTIGVFATGYEAVALPGVHISPSTSTLLAPVTLQPTSGPVQMGSIDGTAVRDDGKSGTAHAVALRNGEQVTEQDAALGSPFVFGDVPYGLYTVTAEVEGYGRSVVQNVLVGDPPLGSPQVSLDTIVVRNVTEDPAPLPVPTCLLPPAQRGPCVIAANPPQASVLPAMGTVEILLDKKIDHATAGMVLSSGTRTATPELVSVTDEGTGTRIKVRPRRPLTPGIWTASPAPAVRDTDKPAHAVAGPMPSWLVTGLAAGPAYAGPPLSSTNDGGGQSLRPGLAVSGNTAYLAYRDEFVDPKSGSSQVLEVASFTPGGVLVPTAVQSQAGGKAFPGPLLLDSADGTPPVTAVYKACPTSSDGSLFAARPALPIVPVQLLGSADSSPCADAAALAPGQPLLMAMPRRDGHLVIYAGDASGQFNSTQVPFPVTSELAMADAGSSRYLFALDDQKHGRLFTITSTAVSEDSTIQALLSGQLLTSVAACAADDHLVLAWTTDGGGSAAAILSGAAFVALPTPARVGKAVRATCRQIQSTAFLVMREDQVRPALYASYLSVDDSSLDRSTWAPLFDPSQADGGLNPYRSDCADPTHVLEDPVIGPDPQGGALVAWSQLCATHREVDLRRIH